MNSNMQNQFDELLHQKLYDFCDDPDEGLIDKIHQKKDRVIRLYRLIPIILSVVAITLAGIWFSSSENDRKNLMPAFESKPAFAPQSSVYSAKPVSRSGARFIATGNAAASVASSQAAAVTNNNNRVVLMEDAIPAATQKNLIPDRVSSSEITGCEASFDFYTSYTGELFFINSSSMNNNTSVHWDFGDGNGSDELNPSHQYQKPAGYVVQLALYVSGKPACNLSKVIQYTSSPVGTGKIIKGTVFEELFISKDAIVSLYKQTTSGDKYELYSLHKTDASGNYMFTHLPDGKYVVLAEKNGTSRFVPTWYGNVTLNEDADRIVLDDRDRHSNRLFDIHLQQVHLSDPLDMTASSTRVDTGGAYVTLVDRYNNVVGTFKTDIYGNLISGQTEIPPGYYKVINPATSKESTIEIGSGNSGTINHYSDLVTDKTRDESKPLMPADPLVIMPNPAVSDIRFEIKLDTYQQVVVRIINANGIEVYNETTSGEPGANKFNIVVSSFKPGVYYVMVKKGQGAPVISQLIKAN